MSSLFFFNPLICLFSSTHVSPLPFSSTYTSLFYPLICLLFPFQPLMYLFLFHPLTQSVFFFIHYLSPLPFSSTYAPLPRSTSGPSAPLGPNNARWIASTFRIFSSFVISSFLASSSFVFHYFQFPENEVHRDGSVCHADGSSTFSPARTFVLSFSTLFIFVFILLLCNTCFIHF